MNNRLFIIALIILLIAIFAVSGIIIYNVIENKKEIEEDAIALTLKDNLEVEFLSKVKVSDLIESLNGELLEDRDIETTSLGEHEIVFNYKSLRNKVKTKSFKINIIDTKNPVIYMSNSMTVQKGYNKDLVETILSGDECDSNPIRMIEGGYDLDTVR